MGSHAWSKLQLLYGGSMDMNKLEVDSVRMHYGHRALLTDVHLSVARGEVLGLLGRNGSGKSTLLKIIFGTVVPESAHIKVNGRWLGTRRSRRNAIQYVPDHPFLPRHAKASTLASIMCSRESQRTLWTMPELQSIKNKSLNQLSGGEARFFELCLMLHARAPFLMLDEPFKGLSPIWMDKAMTLIQARTSSKGLVITDHDYHRVMALADRLMLVYQGQLKPIGEEEELVRWGYLPQGE